MYPDEVRCVFNILHREFTFREWAGELKRVDIVDDSLSNTRNVRQLLHVGEGDSISLRLPVTRSLYILDSIVGAQQSREGVIVSRWRRNRGDGAAS